MTPNRSIYIRLAWSITMASYALQTPISTPLTYLGLFGTGAFIMRGAGCTINDMWDRNLDKSVGMCRMSLFLSLSCFTNY